MDPFGLPQMAYEEKALYRRFTFRQAAILGPAAIASFAIILATLDVLPVMVQVVLAGVILGLAALQALVRRDGRSPLGWLFLWLRYCVRPRIAVWRPRPMVLDSADRTEAAFTTLSPGVLCPTWTETEPEERLPRGRSR